MLPAVTQHQGTQAAESAWDRLLDLLDHFAADPRLPITADVERTFAALCSEGMAEGTIDRELHVADTARWLAGLVVAHHAVRQAHPEVEPDDDLAELRLLATRWLHPARPGR